MGVRKLGMSMILARDFDKLLDWYTNVLGLQSSRVDQEGQWASLRFPEGDATIALHGGLAAGADQAGLRTIVPLIEVSDIQATVEELKGQGLEFTREVHEGAGVWLASFDDPEGNSLQLYEMRGR
ncbi:MAG: VOC family protein [Actinomycetota bacterium]